MKGDLRRSSVRMAAVVPALLALAASAAGAAGPGGHPFEQYLNIRSTTRGSLSPDASRVAFLTNITGSNQVWMVGARGGWPEQITFFPDRVQWVRWSPPPPGGPDHLIFGKDVGGNERTQLFIASPDGSSVEPLTSSPKTIHTFGGWSHDGRRIAYASNERSEAFFDIYVMNLSTRVAERVLTHDGNNSVAAWAPDDSALVIERDNASLDQDLFLLDLKTRSLKHLTPHEGKAIYQSVSWPPGDIIYLRSDQDRDLIGVAAIDVRAPKVTLVEETPHDVEALVFSEDGRRVLVATNQNGSTHVSIREGGIKGKELPPLDLGGPVLGTTGGFEFSRDGRLLCLRRETSSEPGDVWIHDPERTTTWRVTHSSLGGIPRESFVEPELVSYTAADGLKIPALLYLPRGGEGAGGLRPAVVMIHGGPEGQSRPGLSQVNQFLVGRGYAVMAPNIRGSTGYGKRYHRLDDGRLRADAIKDVAAAAQFLKASGRVDPDRIAVMGGSYGGYMTLAALTFHPDLWAAGVDIVGISNFKSFLKNTGAWRVKLRASEYGDPVADSEFLDSISPLNHVERIRAPLFVIQGANDPRVPKSEADQMVGSLRQRNHPVEYLVFDDEGHGVAKLGNRIKAYTAVAEFLDRHLASSSRRGSVSR